MYVFILFILFAIPECSIARERESLPLELQIELKKSLYRLDSSKGTLEDYTLAEDQLLQIVNQDEKHIDALFHLGLVQIFLGSYENAVTNLKKVVSLGGTYARHHIRRLQFEKKVDTTKEELFLAICYVNGYTLPISETDFEFSCQMTHIRNLKFGELSVSRALCATTLENAGLISVPILWIMDPTGFHNKGRIEAQLLIVGEEEVKLQKDNRKKSRVR
jgi:hypothetical protein